LPKTTPVLVGEIPTMIVKIFDKNGLRIIERRYDYANHADVYNQLTAIDTVLKEFPNEPMPKIQFRPSPDPTVRHTAPCDLSTEDFDL
jgi:hypothetical protein